MLRVKNGEKVDHGLFYLHSIFKEVCQFHISIHLFFLNFMFPILDG